MATFERSNRRHALATGAALLAAPLTRVQAAGDIAGGKPVTLVVSYPAGGGADVMVTERIFGRVEYRYTDFGSETFNTGSGDRSVDDKDHRIQFGLGIKF